MNSSSARRNLWSSRTIAAGATLAVVIGCGGGTARNTPAPRHVAHATVEPTSQRKLCVNLATAKGNNASLPPDWTETPAPKQVSALVETLAGHDASPAFWSLLAGGGAVAVYAGCKPQCKGMVVTVDGGGKLVKRFVLPYAEDGHVGGGDGVSASAGIANMPGGGGKLLWIAYDVDGESLPAVGATTTGHLTALRLPDLTEVVDETTSIRGATSVRRCEARLMKVDLDCDGVSDLLLERTCGLGFCLDDTTVSDPECKKETVKTDHVGIIWNSKLRRFRTRTVTTSVPAQTPSASRPKPAN